MKLVNSKRIDSGRHPFSAKHLDLQEITTGLVHKSEASGERPKCWPDGRTWVKLAADTTP
jgi:hypothetical protein